MDEPTAALSAHEVGQLFEQVRLLTAAGVAVLFISHRLEEVFEIADRVTVLRDGRVISSRPVAQVTQALAVKDMVGRDLSDFFARTRQEPGDVVLRVDGLGRSGVFSGITFDVRAARGARVRRPRRRGPHRRRAGTLRHRACRRRSRTSCRGSGHGRGRRAQALRAGVAYVSEDRRRLGLSLPQSVTANVTLATLRNYVNRLRLLDGRAERATAERFREKLAIRTPSLDTPVERLSGGNQQKTMLAKWLNAQPKVLVLDEPTRGIDVAAKAEVHHIVDELAASGMAIILISSDLPEVLAMSDRVLVMREGRQVAVLSHAEATEEAVSRRGAWGPR